MHLSQLHAIVELSGRQAKTRVSAIAAIGDSLGPLRLHYRRMRDLPVEAGLAIDAPVDAIRLELRGALYNQNALLPLGAVDRILCQAAPSLDNAISTNGS